MHYIAITSHGTPLANVIKNYFSEKNGFRRERKEVRKNVISGLDLNVIVWKRVDMNIIKNSSIMKEKEE